MSDKRRGGFLKGLLPQKVGGKTGRPRPRPAGRVRRKGGLARRIGLSLLAVLAAMVLLGLVYVGARVLDFLENPPNAAEVLLPDTHIPSTPTSTVPSPTPGPRLRLPDQAFYTSIEEDNFERTRLTTSYVRPPEEAVILGQTVIMNAEINLSGWATYGFYGRDITIERIGDEKVIVIVSRRARLTHLEPDPIDLENHVQITYQGNEIAQWVARDWWKTFTSGEQVRNQLNYDSREVLVAYACQQYMSFQNAESGVQEKVYRELNGLGWTNDQIDYRGPATDQAPECSDPATGDGGAIPGVVRPGTTTGPTSVPLP